MGMIKNTGKFGCQNFIQWKHDWLVQNKIYSLIPLKLHSIKTRYGQKEI